MIESMLDQICGQNLFDDIVRILLINPETDSMYTGAWEVVEKILVIIEPLAVMLLFIYFMLAVIDKMSSENFTWEQFIRQLAMLLAAKFLIEHGLDIIKILYSIGLVLVTQVQNTGALADMAVDAKDLYDAFESSMDGESGIVKVFKKFIMIIFLILPWAGSFILQILVKVICYTRLIEIYIRIAFYPVALSDFFHSGFQGSGWRYLKNFLAVSLQGAVILLIAIIFSQLFGGMVASQLTADGMNLFEFLGLYFAFVASAIMLMFKSLGLTKELLGTN